MWRNGGMLETTDSYGKKTQRVYGHQEILDMIRNKGAKNIVIAGGLDWSYYFDGLCDGYNGMEHGYKLEDKTGNGVIYDTHIYPMKPEYNPVEKPQSVLQMKLLYLWVNMDTGEKDFLTGMTIIFANIHMYG